MKDYTKLIERLEKQMEDFKKSAIKHGWIKGA